MGTDGEIRLVSLAALFTMATVAVCSIASASPSCPPYATRPPEPAQGGELAVKVAPSQVTLGATQEVRVEAAVPAGSSKVELVAYLGAIAQVNVDEKGHATALYTPPKGFSPGIDIVAVMAKVNGAWRFGYTALPLIGQGIATVTTRPRAMATIRIGTTPFGPVRANEKGKAEIPVLVPPGVGCGYDDRQKAVDLGAPAQAGAALFAAPLEVPAWATEPRIVFGALVSPDASLLLEEVAPEVSVDKGAVSITRQGADGALFLRVTPPLEGANQIEVALRRPGEPAVFLGLPIVPRPPPPPKNVVTPPPITPPLQLDNLALGATAGLAGTFGNALGPWFGVSATISALWQGHRVFGVLCGNVFLHTLDEPVSGLDSTNDLTGQATTLLVPLHLGLGYRRSLHPRFFLDGAIVGGLGLSRTEVRLPQSMEVESHSRIEKDVGASLGAWVGLGIHLGRTALRLDAGYTWTAPDPALAEPPGLSLWRLALTCDVALLSP